MIKEFINLYRKRDQEGFEKLFNETDMVMPRTLRRQIYRMREGIKTPLPESKPIIEIPASAKEGNRSFRRRILRQMRVKGFLIDKMRYVETRTGRKEFNFMLHPTKGFRLRSRTLSDFQLTKRDEGYSSLILPDLTDEDQVAKVREMNMTAPRLALTNPEYFKKANKPGGIRRKHEGIENLSPVS